jgi:hypothetical protein
MNADEVVQLLAPGRLTNWYFRPNKGRYFYLGEPSGIYLCPGDEEVRLRGDKKYEAGRWNSD